MRIKPLKKKEKPRILGLFFLITSSYYLGMSPEREEVSKRLREYFKKNPDKLANYLYAEIHEVCEMPHCPSCLSEDIELLSWDDYDNTVIHNDFTCQICGDSWGEVYKMRDAAVIRELGITGTSLSILNREEMS